MTPTVDDFQALARSSPWRWSTLHFRYRSPAVGSVEAWLRRPHELLVLSSRGPSRHDGWPYGRSLSVVVDVPERRSPRDVAPILRADGLVAVRPDEWWIEWGDPMYGDYQWVAALDPVELSHHVAIVRLAEGERFGRPTWEARVVALDGYDPRCACCPLVWCEIADRYEFDDDAGSWSPAPTTTYPEAVDVALDLQTGVVVHTAAVGPSSRDIGVGLEILDVDVDLDAVLA